VGRLAAAATARGHGQGDRPDDHGAAHRRARAERIGLVNHCLPEADFESGVARLAEGILANSAHANTAIKRLVHDTDGMPLASGLAHEHFRSAGSRLQQPSSSQEQP
jgi:enoyl-CoA hydratase/carnithine racemase